jgi:hypothetical protein
MPSNKGAPAVVDACPVPTPEEARYAAILSRAEDVMHDEIAKAIARAFETAASELGAIGSAQDMPAPPEDYFVAVAHQGLFCDLCGAERASLEGGDVSVATAIINNYQGLKDSWAQAGQ